MMRILLILCLSLPALCDDVLQYIVGGSDASISDYPYVLSLRTTGSHFCGATLIGTTRAVTAAHCTGFAIAVYTILGGTSDPTVINCETCVLSDLNFLNRHPAYDGNAPGYPNDIAVVGFAPVSYNSNFQPIPLATPSDGNFAGSICTIVGWGQTTSGTLQAAQVRALTNAECINSWGSVRINDGHICVAAPGVSACSGDSGSALECEDMLAGASSWGEASCDPSYPSVYTRISFFYSWIIAQ